MLQKPLSPAGQHRISGARPNKRATTSPQGYESGDYGTFSLDIYRHQTQADSSSGERAIANPSPSWSALALTAIQLLRERLAHTPKSISIGCFSRARHSIVAHDGLQTPKSANMQDHPTTRDVPPGNRRFETARKIAVSCERQKLLTFQAYARWASSITLSETGGLEPPLLLYTSQSACQNFRVLKHP